MKEKIKQWKLSNADSLVPEVKILRWVNFIEMLFPEGKEFLYTTKDRTLALCTMYELTRRNLPLLGQESGVRELDSFTLCPETNSLDLLPLLLTPLWGKADIQNGYLEPRRQYCLLALSPGSPPKY